MPNTQKLTKLKDEIEKLKKLQKSSGSAVGTAKTLNAKTNLPKSNDANSSMQSLVKLNLQNHKTQSANSLSPAKLVSGAGVTSLPTKNKSVTPVSKPATATSVNSEKVKNSRLLPEELVEEGKPEQSITEKLNQSLAKLNKNISGSGVASTDAKNKPEANKIVAASSDNKAKINSLTGAVNEKAGEENEKTTTSQDVLGGEQTQISTSLLDELMGVQEKFAGMTDRDLYKDKLVQIAEDLGLEKLDEIEIDQDKLRQEIYDVKNAETELKKRQLQIDAKNLESENKISDAQDSVNTINSVMDAQKVVAENDLLKRGLARSSIAVMRLGNIEDARAKELIDVQENLSSELSKIESEIMDLNNELDYSLENLDLQLALDVTKELNEKVAELKEKQAEVIEFNNNVSRLEAEYDMKRTSETSEAAKVEKQFAQEYAGKLNELRQQELEAVANKYLYTLSPTEAIKALISSPQIASMLGDSFYDLYYEHMRRGYVKKEQGN